MSKLEEFLMTSAKLWSFRSSGVHFPWVQVERASRESNWEDQQTGLETFLRVWCSNLTLGILRSKMGNKEIGKKAEVGPLSEIIPFSTFWFSLSPSCCHLLLSMINTFSSQKSSLFNTSQASQTQSASQNQNAPKRDSHPAPRERDYDVVSVVN